MADKPDELAFIFRNIANDHRASGPQYAYLISLLEQGAKQLEHMASGLRLAIQFCDAIPLLDPSAGPELQRLKSNLQYTLRAPHASVETTALHHRHEPVPVSDAPAVPDFDAVCDRLVRACSTESCED